VKITDPKGGHDYVNTIVSKDGGAFGVTYTLENGTKGWYTVAVGAGWLPKAAETRFWFDPSDANLKDLQAGSLEMEKKLLGKHWCFVKNSLETGERHLLLGGFAKNVVGFSSSDSQHLISILQEYITRLENTVRWHWEEGDVAIWDNHATQHYAVNDYGEQHRIVRRVTIAGAPPFSVAESRGVLGRRPVRAASLSRRSARSGVKSPGSARQVQLPRARPGVFMRASLPRAKTSWSGTTARSATDV
jgi:hypothetical protein